MSYWEADTSVLDPGAKTASRADRRTSGRAINAALKARGFRFKWTTGSERLIYYIYSTHWPRTNPKRRIRVRLTVHAHSTSAQPLDSGCFEWFDMLRTTDGISGVFVGHTGLFRKNQAGIRVTMHSTKTARSRLNTCRRSLTENEYISEQRFHRLLRSYWQITQSSW